MTNNLTAVVVRKGSGRRHLVVVEPGEGRMVAKGFWKAFISQRGTRKNILGGRSNGVGWICKGSRLR